MYLSFVLCQCVNKNLLFPELTREQKSSISKKIEHAQCQHACQKQRWCKYGMAVPLKTIDMEIRLKLTGFLHLCEKST